MRDCKPLWGPAGRQDVLGLAISLVATVPEKVWYCSVKGYTPWDRPKAADVRTRDEGGHTIWYEEPQLIKVREDIDTRLQDTDAKSTCSQNTWPCLFSCLDTYVRLTYSPS